MLSLCCSKCTFVGGELLNWLLVFGVYYVKAESKCICFYLVYCHHKSVKFNFLVWVLCWCYMWTLPACASTVYMLTQWWRGGIAKTLLLNWHLIQILMPVFLRPIWQWCVQQVTWQERTASYVPSKEVKAWSEDKAYRQEDPRLQQRWNFWEWWHCFHTHLQ